MATKVKDQTPLAGARRRRNGHTRISTKNQVTIPVAALTEAGIRPGDELRVAAIGPGRLELTLEEDVIEKYAGFMTGVYPPGYLKKLRGEWKRKYSRKYT